ncbi:G2/M phase-specific E3 ubiquitin-protein ligase isoform X2 [Protopterus annectens]|uniref:G2/M phase-specific E3 ubiquitin-protein ligase isoform X2 n=1 Tax=Protopterus annectens TaxID=7888 RepID=UPI001CFB2227|nr:G2/M phase-specific E3 ubiquitin-protein ligase isoform X2 [Protopterus annectens]
MSKQKQDGSKRFSCVFCRLSDDCPDKYGEKMIFEEYKLTLHYCCLFMASGIWQRGNEDEGIYGFLVEDIRKEVSRALRLTCKICKKTGATIGCSGKKCRRTYHFPCGLEKQCIFQYTDPFASYCWEHRPVQKAAKRRRGSGPALCTICLEHVDTIPSFSILKSPCCKNTWFHRDCLQTQALSAGMFFFRCTVCNNKDLFQNEMLRMGIHIPERDASWELEENAYQDLLESHQRCEVRRCQCDKGREYNEPGSQWEIKRCQSCGSNATHFACSLINRWCETWECNLCRDIICHSGSLQRLHSMSPFHSETKKNSKLEVPFSPFMHPRLSGSDCSFSRSAADILQELGSQIEVYQVSRFNVGLDDVWDGALEGFKNQDFSPAKKICVSFSSGIDSESEADNWCPTRKFLKLLWNHLKNSSLFEGSPQSKNLTFDPQASSEDLYYEAGRMIAVSLVHGGPSPNCFSKTLFHCLVIGPEKAEPTLEDVADFTVVQKIRKIAEAETLEDLKAAVRDCSAYLSVTKNLSFHSIEDKKQLEMDMIRFYVIRRVHSSFIRFQEGLKTLGVLEKIQLYPDVFRDVLCYKSQELTHETLCSLFKIKSLSEDWKKLEDEVNATEFWNEYLRDTDAGLTNASLESILLFATGADFIPAIGFNPEPSVVFVPQSEEQSSQKTKLPQNKMVQNCLKLPVFNTYRQFRKHMDTLMFGLMK